MNSQEQGFGHGLCETLHCRPKFELMKLYANLGHAACSEDKDFYAVIWTLAD